MPKSLEKLRQKQKQLTAQIRDAQARESKLERKRDTRRKIIAGALALNHMEKNKASDWSRKMNALIDEYVTKPTERALFGLPPLPENENDKPEKTNPADAGQ